MRNVGTPKPASSALALSTWVTWVATRAPNDLGRDSQEKKFVEKLVEKFVEKFVEIYYTGKMEILE